MAPVLWGHGIPDELWVFRGSTQNVPLLPYKAEPVLCLPHVIGLIHLAEAILSGEAEYDV